MVLFFVLTALVTLQIWASFKILFSKISHYVFVIW